MKIIKTPLFPLIIVLAIAAFPACKAKKLAVTPQPVPPAPVTTVTPPPPTPAPEKQVPPPPPALPPPIVDAVPGNIQFEFNSAILKTSSYPILDAVADGMKKDTASRFVLNGNASAEGTADHNMTLSVQRANSVKLYLVNTGVPARMLSIKGYGESNPIADNTTEEGRAINRRVEIKKQ